MSNDEITLKEFIHMRTEELSQSIKEVHEIASNGLTQATKTNDRVNTIEETLERVGEIIERHDRLLVMDEGRSSTKQTLFKVAMWLTFPVISMLSYFGWLYIEHVKQEVVVETSKQVINLIVIEREEFIKKISERVVSYIEGKYDLQVK